MYTQEKLLQQKIVYEKQCVTCKVVTGSLFLGMTAFHSFRISQIWKFYAMREKVFNGFMLSILGGLSGLSYFAAYQIYLGKTMRGEVAQPIELRQGYTDRLSNAFNFYRMSDEQKLEYINNQIK